jgi:hypothetical protein
MGLASNPIAKESTVRANTCAREPNDIFLLAVD